MRTICVVGLGYIGLPTAAMFASSNFSVRGVDINEKVVGSLCEGKVHIEEPGLAELVRQAVSAGTLTAGTSPLPADTFIIAVPTPVGEDHRADLGAVVSAARSLIPHLTRGCLVILESTSPPGTTIGILKPILEESGLQAGIDFNLCYSPERVLPGKILTELVQNDRVVGGVTPASADQAKNLYASFVKGEIFTTDATTAEMVKIMENTFRDVNIALANEFALISGKLGINVWEAIRLANRHPRVKVLNPGPGVGGHCIAVDPWFLVEAAPKEAQIVRLAREVNDGMPHHVLALVAESLQHRVPAECVITCLGLTFKANVGDTRESPALQIVEMLLEQGYTVRSYDPHVQPNSLPSIAKAGTIEASLEDSNLLLLLVDHAEFKGLSPELGALMATKHVIDTRNILVSSEWTEAGFRYSTLGQP